MTGCSIHNIGLQKIKDSTAYGVSLIYARYCAYEQGRLEKIRRKALPGSTKSACAIH